MDVVVAYIVTEAHKNCNTLNKVYNRQVIIHHCPHLTEFLSSSAGCAQEYTLYHVVSSGNVETVHKRGSTEVFSSLETLQSCSMR